jgi:rhodanese-related sulfurtransferase
MTTVETIRDPTKAREFFEDKVSFTCGPVELSYMIKESQSINVIDVRAAEDYKKGHIPGALNLPRGSWENPEGLSRDKTNVVYCYTQQCHLAAKAALEFADQGFPVMEMEGGFEAWKQSKFPVEK